MNWEKILFKSGDLFLPISVRNLLETYLIGNDTSKFYVTFWTLIHFLSGVFTGFTLFKLSWVKTYFFTGFLIHTLWELWQILGKNTKYWTLRGQVDILVDTTAFMLGMFLYLKIQTLTKS